jgi:hypothetical protein
MKYVSWGLALAATCFLVGALVLWRLDNRMLWTLIHADQAKMADLKVENQSLGNSLDKLDAENAKSGKLVKAYSLQASQVADQRDRLQGQYDRLNSQVADWKQKNTDRAQSVYVDSQALQQELASYKKGYDDLELLDQEHVRDYRALYADYQSLAATLQRSTAQYDSGGIHHDQLSGDAAAAYAPSAGGGTHEYVVTPTGAGGAIVTGN